MGFFRRIFGGGDKGEPRDSAWHFYVKSKFADEILDVRIDAGNDLSPEFDGPGDYASHYTVTKEIIGSKSFKTISLHLIFDTTRSFTGDFTIEGGELVEQDVFDSWKAQQQTTNVSDTNVDSD